jgi:gluconate:H+ symporter, GntP family
LIPAGLILGVVTSLSGYWYAAWLNRKYPLPLREDVPEVDGGEVHEARVPSLWAALLPIMVPVVLIVGNSAAGEGWGVAGAVLGVLGEKNLALGMGAALGLVLLAWSRWGERGAVGSAVGEALASGGVIILITAAGSAFGSAMGASGVAGQLAGWMPGGGGGLVLLWVAFGVTALVRMAQGSATVAMITAVGIVGPLVGEVELGYHAVYLALAIGCGSKPGPWMNDSGFWVVSRMSGMTEVETLRSFTVQLSLMGVVGFLVVLLGARFLPMV